MIVCIYTHNLYSALTLHSICNTNSIQFPIMANKNNTKLPNQRTLVSQFCGYCMTKVHIQIYISIVSIMNPNHSPAIPAKIVAVHVAQLTLGRRTMCKVAHHASAKKSDSKNEWHLLELHDGNKAIGVCFRQTHASNRT